MQRKKLTPYHTGATQEGLPWVSTQQTTIWKQSDFRLNFLGSIPVLSVPCVRLWWRILWQTTISVFKHGLYQLHRGILEGRIYSRASNKLCVWTLGEKEQTLPGMACLRITWGQTGQMRADWGRSEKLTPPSNNLLGEARATWVWDACLSLPSLVS